jgi:alkyl sulfatase BDS1-like metallo-beta-lactamase superfamily hydrolase
MTLRTRSRSRSHERARRRCARLAVGALGILLLACGPDEPPSGGVAPTAGPGAAPDARKTEQLRDFGKDQTEPLEIAPGIFQARGVGNAHMVVTPEGNVVIDTGLTTQAGDLRDRLRQASDAPTRYVILSHAHLDHAGGTGEWLEDDPVVIAHRTFPETQRYLVDLVPYFIPKNKVYYPEDIPDLPIGMVSTIYRRMYPTIEPTLLIDEEYAFELGGTRFEVIPTPGAEGEDSISVWLPDQKILFTGDFFGPLFPMWPNLYTIRGEKTRFAMPYVESLDKVLALEPEMIVPSHFEPIVGKERIRQDVTRMRDAVLYVHDATVEGMNDGKDVHTLMREIQLPPELALSEGHGKVSWGVRTIWESYSGWFHDETVQLYAVEPSTVWAEIVEMAGGPQAVATRARARLDAGRPVEALHLVAMSLEADPNDRTSLEVRLAALQELMRLGGGVNHSEVYWLKHRIAATEEALGG